MTEEGTVIMGRKTWISLPVKPLVNRRNVVLTHDKWLSKDIKEKCPEVAVYNSIEKVIVKEDPNSWIIGGRKVYQQALDYEGVVDEAYITVLPFATDGDVQFPMLDESWEVVNTWKIHTKTDEDSDIEIPYFRFRLIQKSKQNELWSVWSE